MDVDGLLAKQSNRLVMANILRFFQHLPPLNMANMANWNARATIEVWGWAWAKHQKRSKRRSFRPKTTCFTYRTSASWNSNKEHNPGNMMYGSIYWIWVYISQSWGCKWRKGHQLWDLGAIKQADIWARPCSTAYLHRSTKPRLSQDTCVIFASTPRRAEATESSACRFQQLKAWAFKPTSVHISWRQHSAHSQSFTKLHNMRN